MVAQVQLGFRVGSSGQLYPNSSSGIGIGFRVPVQGSCNPTIVWV